MVEDETLAAPNQNYLISSIFHRGAGYSLNSASAAL